jgi:hypothetical protein
MNEIQETILDTLMVADRIGDRWKPGPLPLALAALQTAGLTRRREPGPALGFPPLLCAAVEGAATTIRNVDDCRTLAISLFSEISPRKKAPRLTGQQLIAAVLWSLRGVPAYYAPERAPTREVVGGLEDHLAGRPCAEQTIQRLDNALDHGIESIDSGRVDYVTHRLALSAFYFALHSLRRAQKGDDAEDNACLVTRDVARLAGLTQGVTGAIPYCVGLARTLGM